ncbi:MAG: hypothetical protein EXS05_19000 [Planctomycetaceae bacterium]|nr:hypothetical protein [Planctomycetaceae bacterium]
MPTKTKVIGRNVSRTKRRIVLAKTTGTETTPFEIVSTKRGGGELLLRQRLGFTRPQFARLIPVSERSLAAIEKGKAAAETVSRSLAQIQRLISALEEVIEPAVIGCWLTIPNQALEGLKPLEVIERGEIDRIWTMIYHLRSGAAF